jgi:hypothetical protein
MAGKNCLMMKTQTCRSLGRDKAMKLTVTLYQTDLDCLDQIKYSMTLKGYRRLSDSEAFRLACRSLDPVTQIEQLLESYHSMIGDDGRRNRGRQIRFPELGVSPSRSKGILLLSDIVTQDDD